VLTIERSRHNWPPAYFDVLVGVRIAFLEDDGRPASGVLVAVRETTERIELTLADVGPED